MIRRSSPRTSRLAANLMIASVALVGAGCASKMPAPIEQMATSRAAVTQAERGGAGEYAAVELLSAREKLNRADLAMRDGRNEEASRLAEQAEADAVLAAAKARTSQSQKAVDNMKQAIETLRQEIERKSR